jgi:hypothetical protein
MLAGRSRRRIASTLNAAYADGLLSDETFLYRVDQLLRGRVVDPVPLVGDLSLRRAPEWSFAEVASAIRRMTARLALSPDPELSARPLRLLVLDRSGAEDELLIGRSEDCDVVLPDPRVSRHHARLRFRDGNWILQDLDSTNGSLVNGVRVGRCQLRVGDVIAIGDEQLAID